MTELEVAWLAGLLEELRVLHKEDRVRGKVLQEANLVRMTARCKEVLTGKPKSEEHKAKMRKPKTEAHRAKLSEARRKRVNNG